MAPGSAPGTPPADTHGYHYRSRTKRAGRPAWIRAVQWLVFALWLVFSYWILLGRGRLIATATMRVYHGVFAFETALESVVLPNWALVTLAVAALLGWLQVLWVRYGESVERVDGRWRWMGRGGPAVVEMAARTLGGAWCRGSGRWTYVPAGLIDARGKSWCAEACREKAVRLHPLRAASPVLLFLVVLGAAAYLFQRPVMEYKATMRAVRRDVFRSRPRALDALIARHPEFRPFALYLSTLPACTSADCMKKQIAARLEMISIGPDYRADAATPINLLVLNGKDAMAVKLMGTGHPQSFDIAVRTGQLELAKKIQEAHPGTYAVKNPEADALFLLQEHRYDAAYDVLSRTSVDHKHNTVTTFAVTAYLSGHCREAADYNRWLLSPDPSAGVHLYGDAPPTGLGALQRVARDIKWKASYALGLALEGDLAGSARAWRNVEEVAGRSGIPGLLDRDRILMRLVNPAAVAGTAPRGAGARSRGGSGVY